VSFFKGNDLLLNGELRIDGVVNNTSAGQLNDVATNDLNTIRFSSATILTGFANAISGKVISIVNISGFDVTIANDNASSVAGNRILTGNGQDILFSNDSIIDLQYDSISSVWRILGGTGSNITGLNEVPSGSVDGSNRFFTLSKIPVYGTLIVFRNGIKVEISEYSFLGQIITMNVAPAIAQKIEAFYIATGGATSGGGGGVGSANFVVDYPSVNATDLINKYVVLSGIPNPATKTVLDIPTGTPQIYGTDFIVSGNQLSWNALGLDGQVNLGDTFRVQYFT
jgi:hypothetical protein